MHVCPANLDRSRNRAGFGASLRNSPFSSLPWGFYLLADRANGLVRARLLETQRYPHLVADQNSFSEAARIALQYVLMDERLMLPGDEGLLASLTELDRRLDRETTRALDSMVWVDTDDDNVVDTGEVAPISIRMVM